MQSPAARACTAVRLTAGICLTSGQVAALKKIYGGPRELEGQAALFELVLGWRHLGPADRGGTWWAAWNVALAPVPGVNTAANLTLGAGAVPMIFVTPPVVTPVAGPTGQEAYLFHFDFDKDAPEDFRRDPGLSAEFDGLHGRRLAGPEAVQKSPRQTDCLVLRE